MKIKTKMLSLCIIPIMLTGIISVIISAGQFSSGMYSEISESLKASSIAALNVYNSQGYGNYSLKEDGSVWRGMNFNVSEETGIVDSIKEETGVDITFFYEKEAVMTSMTDENGGRYIGMQAGKNITEYTLMQGAQMYYENIEIGDELYHAYIIPITQPDSGEVIGALMATRSVERLESILRNNLVTMISVTIGIMVLFVVCAVIFVNTIVKGIRSAGNVVKKVSAGELGDKIENKVVRKDEIGELGKDINALQQKLVSIVGTINNSSGILNTASNQLSRTASSTLDAAKEMSVAVETITQNTVNQAAESRDVSTSMQDMGEMLGDSLQEVDAIQGLSEDMYQLSQDTAGILNELKESNEQSRRAIEEIYEQTSVTNTSAQDIKTVTEFITSIAEETNLLSLNASIEAARAGEQGKGFAVVALEIQKLAEQSNTSAKQIEEIVESLVSKTENTVSVMEEVKRIMETQNLKVSETQDIFGKLENNIILSTDKVKHISEITKQIDKVKYNMTSIMARFADSAESNASVAQETSAMTSQVAEEFAKVSELAEELKKLSSQLEEDVSYFSYE